MSINKSFEYIQRYITILETYYQKWKIKINADKSKSIYFTKKRKDTKTIDLKFYNNINNEKTVIYLGVILDTKVNFDAHIDQVINKSNIALKEIYTLINKNSPLDKNLK